MILFLLLLTLALFPALRFLAGMRHSALENRPLLLGAICALLAAALIVVYLDREPQWRAASEIAWTGVGASTSSDPLVMGGPREQALVGWPNGAFFPVLDAQLQGQRIGLKVTGGGGFVEFDREIRNGTAFSVGHPVTVGDFDVQVLGEEWWHFWNGTRFRIVHRSQGLAADFFLNSSKIHVYSLQQLAEVPAAQLRKDKATAGLASQLENWAFGRRLLIRNNSEFRILSSDDIDTLSVPNNSDLTLHWVGLSQTFRLQSKQGVLEALFAPPWRVGSPLPPSTESTGSIQLKVTGRPLPGDVAFVVPLGGPSGKFSETITLSDNQFDRPEGTDTSPIHGIVSERLVRFPHLTLRISLIKDLWSPLGFAVALALALGMFWGGLAILWSRLRLSDQWTIAGLLLSLWVILLVRILLALRYASEPTYLDGFALRGVANAFLALVLIPALIALAARLRHDLRYPFDSVGQKARAGNYVLLYAFLTLAVGCAVEFAITKYLWPNLENLVSLGWLWTTFLVLGIAVILVRIVAIYRLDESKVSSVRLRSILRWIHDWLVEWEPLKAVATDTGQSFWQKLGVTTDGVLDYPTPTTQERRQTWLRVARVLVWIIGILLLMVFFFGAIGQVRVGQEIIGPITACWLPAVLWLTIRQWFTPQSKMSAIFNWPFYLGLSVLVLLLPVFALPIVLRDTGGVVSTLAVFLPLLALLRAGAGPRRVWLVPFLAILLAFAGVFLFYLNLQPLLPAAHYMKFGVGEAPVRLLVFKKGARAAVDMLSAAVLSEDSATPARKIGQGLEHAWENTAIAHRGDWRGIGFANAPTRRSGIPQQTLAADSTFSFYIFSEYGLLGAGSLLLLYFFPLIFILLSARLRFDVGHALAALVASAFLLEALTHAAMNLGILPFTGRNLPLLAVGSRTDFLKWLILFSVAARALLWRNKNLPTGFSTPFSMISNESTFAARGQESLPEPRARYWKSVAWIVSLPAFMLGVILTTGYAIVGNNRLEKPFDWSSMESTIQEWVDTGDLYFDEGNKEIIAKPSISLGAESLLGQEIERFNEQSEDEKFGRSSPHGPTNFMERLRQMSSIQAYDELMNELRTRDQALFERHRPLLFELTPPLAFVDESDTIPTVNAPYGIRMNRDYFTSTDFESRRQLPSVAFRDGIAGTFMLSGGGAEIFIPLRKSTNLDHRVVMLERVGNSLREIQDTFPTGSRATLTLRFLGPSKPRKGKKAGAKGTLVSRDLVLGEFEATADGGLSLQPNVQLDRKTPSGKYERLRPGVRTRLAAGDTLQLAAQIATGFQPSLEVHFSSRGALIGDAWVNGHSVVAYDPDPVLPWTIYLASALPGEKKRLGDGARQHYRTLTIDRRLQEIAESFSTQVGRNHYNEYLQTTAARSEPQPPRIGLAVINLSGEVLAVGGWPRMSSGSDWQLSPAGDWIPPVTWVEDKAPAVLRNRYSGDRNFDPVEIGSAGKPIWASAVIGVHPDLPSRLAVSGPPGPEADVFGITITNRPWTILHESTSLDGKGWCDLPAYLARSDNRYQLRLGFLGLALPDRDSPSTISEEGNSPSTHESMDRGGTAWHRFPRFPLEIDFGSARPKNIRDLDRTSLAEHLLHMFSISTSRGMIDFRRSFWTGDERHDRPEEPDRPFNPSLDNISPKAPDFSLNTIRDPRQYANLLLGGGNNRWANVDLAAAFATVVTGTPILAHATMLPSKQVLPFERESFAVSELLKRGLTAVAMNNLGTAHAGLSGTGALAAIGNMGRVQIYAKTGTLRTRKDRPPTSRILIALVVEGSKPHGLVLALFVERATEGDATRLIGHFISANRQELERVLAQ